MLTNLGVLALLAAAASGYTGASQRIQDEEFEYGRFAVGPDFFQVTNETSDLLNDAVTRPNLTHTVSFQPFGPIIATSPFGDHEDVRWEWRECFSPCRSPPILLTTYLPSPGINVTEVEIPGARLGHETDVIPRMTLTTHDLSWRGGGNMSSQLAGNGSTATDGDGLVPFCVKSINFFNGFARNVTNAFGDDDASDTGCAPALGMGCVQAILDDPMLTDDGCNTTTAYELSWHRIPACRDSLGFSAEGSGGIVQAFVDMNSRLDNSTFRWQQESGQRFMYTRTPPYDPGAEDAGRAFRNESRALQVMLVQTFAPGREGRVRTSELVCARVDTDEYEGAAGGRARAAVGGSIAVALGVAVMMVL